MPAFNRRFEIKRIGGMPLPAAVALISSVVFGVLTMILPLLLKIVCGVLFIASLILAIFVFYMGENFPLRAVIFAAKREANHVTSEVVSKL